jgi:hypothetical protein
MDSKAKFIEGVLGNDGAQALRKVAAISPVLENALLPRTIIAWLSINARGDFEGELPGVTNTYLSFKKYDQSYSGIVTIDDENYSFNNASLYHLAASIAVALGADGDQVDPALRNRDLVNLGKSIETLAKARVVVRELKNRKAEPPGAQAAPQKQGAPQAAMPGQKQPAQKQVPPPKPPGIKPPKGPKTSIPKLPSLKMAMSEAGKKCGICGGTQFKGNAFTGCLCFRDLAKSVTVKTEGSNFVLDFGREWDRESLSVFLETVNGR